MDWSIEREKWPRRLSNYWRAINFQEILLLKRSFHLFCCWGVYCDKQLSRDFVAEAFLPLVGEFTAIRLVCSYHLVFSWKVSFFFDFTFTQLRCSWENNAPSCWSETLKCGNSSASVENCKKPCLNFYYNCSSLGTSNFLD